MTFSEARFRTPYATRLRGVAMAGAAVDPKCEELKVLLRQTRGLEAATKVAADALAGVLVADCRRTLDELAAQARERAAGGEDAGVLDAVCLDGRAALNRLAGMIRNNDPDPNEPKG